MTPKEREAQALVAECESRWANEYSNQTVQNYRSSLRTLGAWLGKQGKTLLDVEPADLPAFLTWRANYGGKGGEGVGPSRRVSDWQAITRFYVWLAKIDPDAFPSRGDKPVVLRSFDRPADKQDPITYAATEDDVRKLLAACAKHRDKVTGRRNAAMLAVLWCGLRRTELHVLDVGHVDLEQDIITVPVTKNGDVRRVPIDRDTHDRLFLVMRDRKFVQDSPLFVGRKGRLTPSGIEQALQWPRRQAKLTHVGLHAFRRGWATDLLNQPDMERKHVMTLGGWRDERSMRPYDKNNAGHQAIEAYRRAKQPTHLRAVK